MLGLAPGGMVVAINVAPPSGSTQQVKKEMGILGRKAAGRAAIYVALRRDRSAVPARRHLCARSGAERDDLDWSRCNHLGAAFDGLGKEFGQDLGTSRGQNAHAVHAPL